MKCRKQDMCSPGDWTLQSAVTRSQDWERQLWNDQVMWILLAFSARDWKSQRGVYFMAWILLIMRGSYLFLIKMVLSQANLCTETQKIHEYCLRKINIPFPVKFIIQHRRIPKGPVPTGVNSRLPQFCCCRVSSLTKSSQGQTHTLLQFRCTSLDAFPLFRRGINTASVLS